MSTKVKICGIKTEAALDAALDAGADFVGFVLFAKSPRNVTLEDAAALARRAHARGGAKVVTLLVDPDDALVDSVAARVKPDMIQLHGHETPARTLEIRARAGLPILKAVAVCEAADVEAPEVCLGFGGAADILLFDAKPPADSKALPGGNGLAFDWRILEAVRGRFPYALAGGLTPDNVAAAIALTGAAIVDVSSGVESSPGEKDLELIRRFLRAAKAAREA